MRRPLLLLALATALGVPGAAPASAAEDICFNYETQGDVLPHVTTGTFCTVNVYDNGMYCEHGWAGVKPEGYVVWHTCTPTIIPWGPA
ncbi:MAG TPA: hypothetical protein VGX28_11135 [Frankiaceae bacterium]|jgi:hypothetical protein|nr:hypothetical protein [Frankiaceae bacterium]